MKNKRLKKGYHRLPGSAITQAGDLPIYADGSMGDSPITSIEQGIKVQRTGYTGIARKTKT